MILLLSVSPSEGGKVSDFLFAGLFRRLKDLETCKCSERRLPKNKLQELLGPQIQQKRPLSCDFFGKAFLASAALI